MPHLTDSTGGGHGGVSLPRQNLLICVLLFAVGAALLRFFLIQEPEGYDEGLVLVGASRVAHGQIPYRDFWTLYSPGQFYALAALFKFFGQMMEVERWWDLVCRAVIPVLSYVVAAGVCSRKAAVLAWGLLLGWVAYFGYPGYTLFPAIACCLASFALLSSHFANRSKSLLFIAGVMAGVGVLFRIDFGLYCTLATVIPLVIFAAKNPAENVGKTVITFLAGAAVIVLPVAVYFLFEVPLHVLVYDLLVFPLTVFPRYRGLPLPTFTTENAYFYLLLLPLVAGLVLPVLFWKRHPESRKYLLTVFGLALFGVFELNQARVRSSPIHAGPYVMTSVLLLSVFLGSSQSSLAVSRKAIYTLRILCGALLLGTSWVPVWSSAVYASKLAPYQNSGSKLATAPTILLNPEWIAIVRYIDSHSNPGEYIYVGVTPHDRIFVNEPLFYFLADRPCPTKYDELHPGQATTAPVQQEIADDLEKHDVKLLVLLTWRMDEPNESAVSSGVHILDDYIAAHYKVVARSQYHLILQRK